MEHRNELIDNWNDRIYNEHKYNIEKCINELTSLLGSTVYIFGRKTQLNKNIPELCVDTREWLTNIQDNEIDLMDIIKENNIRLDDSFWNKLKNDMLDVNNELMNILIDNGIFEELDNRCGNTYNWNSTVYNGINWQGYKKVGDDECYYYLVDIHKYGDVRGGYTDSIVVCFDYDTGFIESMGETVTSTSFEINGIELFFETDILQETVTCYNEYWEEICFRLLSCDKEDIIGEINEKIQEQVDKLEVGKFVELWAISNKELFKELNDTDYMYFFAEYEIKRIDKDKQVFYIDVEGTEKEIKFTDIYEVQ